jgi:hypothetical protein
MHGGSAKGQCDADDPFLGPEDGRDSGELRTCPGRIVAQSCSYAGMTLVLLLMEGREPFATAIARAP